MAVALCASICGCSDASPARFGVTGRVTVDGRPLKRGGILLVPLEGTPGPKTGAEIVNGQFEIRAQYGPMMGKHQVRILTERPPEYLGPYEAKTQQTTPAPMIPDRYRRFSALFVTVSESEDNHFEFNLTTDPSTH